jgi:hypothetical protein
MKKVDELLSFVFNEHTLQRAKGYARLFASWPRLTTDQGVPAAVDHSRIVELERAIILIEADHPGWIQILQTKQQELLSQFQRQFPELTINGISFCLSRPRPSYPAPALPPVFERPEPLIPAFAFSETFQKIIEQLTKTTQSEK